MAESQQPNVICVEQKSPIAILTLRTAQPPNSPHAMIAMAIVFQVVKHLGYMASAIIPCNFLPASIFCISICNGFAVLFLSDAFKVQYDMFMYVSELILVDIFLKISF